MLSAGLCKEEFRLLWRLLRVNSIGDGRREHLKLQDGQSRVCLSVVDEPTFYRVHWKETPPLLTPHLRTDTAVHLALLRVFFFSLCTAVCFISFQKLPPEAFLRGFSQGQFLFF